MLSISVSHKRPESSIAILNYFAIVPFFKQYVRPSALAERLEEGVPVTGDKVTFVKDTLRNCFKDIAALISKELFYPKGEIADDCNVDIDSVIYETHVVLYLRLPAVIAPHVAMVQIRRAVAKLAEKTDLSPCLLKYGTLLSTSYLLMSGITYPMRAGDYSSFPLAAKVFCEENGIDYKFLDSLKKDQRAQWGSQSHPLDSNFTIY